MKTTILILFAATILVSAQSYRVVDGKVYDSTGWKSFDQTGAMIKVVEDSTNGTICELSQVGFTIGFDGSRRYAPHHISYIVVRNYPTPDDLITDHDLKPLKALQSGRIQTSYGTLPVYDCGLIYTPPPPALLTPEQLAAAKATADDNKKAGNAAALKFNQAAADRGDAYGLLRMGERYRDGDGVAKDLTKARDFLHQAALKGSDTAQRELTTLPQ